ncbi:hypothetical protein PPACK8108_LOCUS9608 [Phakopsora pachyrhizi]|uniref:Uncharacterized protein n=1 Tax=Phakopsora pachyrhizi TaxID=170000 RepID=A0AAV0AWR6_PHAPC|nr:hypothetical protein PPACK8108_LOCUS9608 [Phakopsora pachyrhizi]
MPRKSTPKALCTCSSRSCNQHHYVDKNGNVRPGLLLSIQIQCIAGISNEFGISETEEDSDLVKNLKLRQQLQTLGVQQILARKTTHPHITVVSFRYDSYNNHSGPYSWPACAKTQVSGTKQLALSDKGDELDDSDCSNKVFFEDIANQPPKSNLHTCGETLYRREIENALDQSAIVSCIPFDPDKECYLHHLSVYQINSILWPIVEQLQNLWNPGLFLSQTSTYPPLWRALGFAAPTATRMCSKCLLDKPSINNLEQTSWPERNLVNHRLITRITVLGFGQLSRHRCDAQPLIGSAQMALPTILAHLKELKAESASQNSAEQFLLVDRNSNSEFHKGFTHIYLPSTDHSSDETFEPFSSEFGWDGPWISPGDGKVILDSELVSKINILLPRIIIPSWIKRALPVLGKASQGRLKANEWRNLFTIQLPLILPLFWSGKEFDKRSLFRNFAHIVSLVRCALKRKITAETTKSYRSHLLAYLSSSLTLFPHATLAPNHHMAIHLAESMENFGPVRAWWSFSMERLMGESLKASVNNRIGVPPYLINHYLFFPNANMSSKNPLTTKLLSGHLEITVLKNFCRMGNLQALLDSKKLPTELLPFVSQLKAFKESTATTHHILRDDIHLLDSNHLQMLISKINKLYSTNKVTWISAMDWCKIKKINSGSPLPIHSKITVLKHYHAEEGALREMVQAGGGQLVHLNPGGPLIGESGGVGPEVGGHPVDQGTAGVPKEVRREEEMVSGEHRRGSSAGGDGGPSWSPAPNAGGTPVKGPENEERGPEVAQETAEAGKVEGPAGSVAAPTSEVEPAAIALLDAAEEPEGKKEDWAAEAAADGPLLGSGPGPADLSAPLSVVGKGAVGGGSGMWTGRAVALGSGSEGRKTPQSLAQARISSRHWAWTKGSGSLGFGGFGRRDSWWALRVSSPASPGSSWWERPASEVLPSAEDLRGQRGERKEKKREGRTLTYTSLFETVASIAGAVPAGVRVFALRAGEEAGEAAVPDHPSRGELVWVSGKLGSAVVAAAGVCEWLVAVGEEGAEEGAGRKRKMWEGKGAVCEQAAPAPEQREAAAEVRRSQKPDRASGAGPGRVIPKGGQNMTPGEIFPGVQKSGQIFDSCPGSGTMQGVLDWIRAGLFEDRGIRRMDMDGAEEWHERLTGGSGVRRSWKGDDGDIIRAGGGCGGRNGKGGIGKGGAGSAPEVLRVGFWWILQDFEEEGVTVEGNGWHHWKEGKKLGGGAHQGRSGWSKTTGVTDFFKEAPDLENRGAILPMEGCKANDNTIKDPAAGTFKNLDEFVDKIVHVLIAINMVQAHAKCQDNPAGPSSSIRPKRKGKASSSSIETVSSKTLQLVYKEIGLERPLYCLLMAFCAAGVRGLMLGSINWRKCGALESLQIITLSNEILKLKGNDFEEPNWPRTSKYILQIIKSCFLPADPKSHKPMCPSRYEIAKCIVLDFGDTWHSKVDDSKKQHLSLPKKALVNAVISELS